MTEFPATSEYMEAGTRAYLNGFQKEACPYWDAEKKKAWEAGWEGEHERPKKVHAQESAAALAIAATTKFTPVPGMPNAVVIERK